MRYLITVDTPTEISIAMNEKPEQTKKAMNELLAQLKPEATYFSTTRRLSVLVVNIEDPHVQLRRAYDALSKFGKVTVDPVSTVNEFLRFWEK
jgi:hypothetical protein